jgi:hypothetical protein
MALMLDKTYDALIAAGAPEDKARAAAEELANNEVRLASIDGKLTLLISAVGINPAATMTMLVKHW